MFSLMLEVIFDNISMLSLSKTNVVSVQDPKNKHCRKTKHCDFVCGRVQNTAKPYNNFKCLRLVTVQKIILRKKEVKKESGEQINCPGVPSLWLINFNFYPRCALWGRGRWAN